MFTMTKLRPTSGVLHRIEWHGTSPYGVPYAVVTILDAANETHRALACSRRFGDLSLLVQFEGLSVNLLDTGNGLQLKPFTDQIPPELQLKEDAGLDPDQGAACVGPNEMDDLNHVTGTTFDAVDSAAETPVSKLQEVAATVARLARDLRLPTCMWIHIP
ncbi:MAG: hypothetical protein RLZZ516_1532 [Cyanobacteriota bacterium]|jgi:hypothetical protein